MAAAPGHPPDPLSRPPDVEVAADAGRTAAGPGPAPATEPADAAADAVVREVLASPHVQDLFQLLRRLDAADPGRPRLGHAVRPGRERVRLGQPADLAFAPASVQRTWLDAEGRLHVHQRAFGLLGPNGPMPLHLTEHARDRTRNHHDRTLQAFLDLFHHRMTALFYRAWATCQPVVSRDRPDEDRLADYVAALLGLADETFLGRDAVDDDVRRFHAGRLTCRATNAAGLELVLGDVLGVPVRVEEFAGSWVELPADAWCRLGRGGEPDGRRDAATARLGTAVLGRRIHDPQQAFRLRLGPLDYEQLLAFLPIGGEFVRLRDWVRTYARRAYAWDVRMIVRRAEVPRTRLGDASWLGWTTWVRSAAEAPADDDRLVFTGEP